MRSHQPESRSTPESGSSGRSNASRRACEPYLARNLKDDDIAYLAAGRALIADAPT